MSIRINLLRKFDIRPNIKTYIPNIKKSFGYNFFMDITVLSIVSIYAAIILMICIILFYLVLLFLTTNIFNMIFINLAFKDYDIMAAITGIICFFIFFYLSCKTNNINQKTIFSILGFMFYVSFTVDLIVGYFLPKIDTNLEESVLYYIIIMCTYFFTSSLIYSIIYIYKNNKSYYLNIHTKFIIKIIYVTLYFIFTLLPIFIIYLLYINTPVMFLLICISTICVLFLFMITIVIVNI